MQNFHPNLIRLLVFDLDSVTANYDQQSWDVFRQFLLVLDDRDFAILLVSEYIEASEWESLSKLSVLRNSIEKAFQNNPALLAKDVFWFTDKPEIQKFISHASQNFAGSNSCTNQNGGLQFQQIHDMLQIFHPSRISAADLSAKILKIKCHSQQVPLMLGIGGPDECGHPFFVGELTDALEDKELLVSSLDLSLVLGTEFQDNDVSTDKLASTLWRSEEIRNWVIEEVLRPYSQGQQVYLENPPQFIQEYEVCTFPFFLAPEMILLIWGTTVFLPEFEKLIDVRVLLELSEKTAAARLFALDDRENFDQSLIETYLQKEGKFYAEYLDQFNVQNKIDYRINFENFNAFRLIENS